ncbi:hypothetical protein RA086_05430 [Lactiplantibacillus sp. WILCCON 0030]|uniref:Prophage protein n=1 Tax=Lactiplantibacillus brownii TaxID=3069269 RepID=A0ABU1A9F0_9LACO|nr:hypothetical protein [Lactiplantibacillus brownii]MDQ7937068.1 hypothetical protein [Lactiplantibacillus brownii]
MKRSNLAELLTSLSKDYRIEPCDNETTSIKYKGSPAFTISETTQFEFFSFIEESMPFSHKAYMAVSEYAMTPINERREAQKYVFPIWNNYGGERYFMGRCFYNVTKNIDEAFQASQEKIDGMNYLYAFDLNDIKEEVTNE